MTADSTKIPFIPGLTVQGSPVGAPQGEQATSAAAVPAEVHTVPAPAASDGWPQRYTPGERRRLAAKLTSIVPDNGMVHYGAGLPGSLCGVQVPGRRETNGHRIGVTCPKCQALLKTRPQ